MKKILFFLCLILLFGQNLCAQQNKADSLEKLLAKNLPDTLRVNVWNELSFAIYSIDPSKSKKYADQALELASKISFQKGVGFAYINIGVHFRQKGEFVEALKNISKGLEIFEQLNYLQGVANAYITLGLINGQQSNFAQAHTYHLKALEIYEQLNDTKNAAVCLSNVGYTYFLQNEYKLALEYYFKSLPISRKANDQWREALCYTNIGMAYAKKQEYDTALYYFERSIALAEQINLPIGRMLIAKGESHLAKKEYTQAFRALHTSLKGFEKANNKYYIAEASNVLGKIYFSSQKIDSAIYFYRKGVDFAKMVGGKAFLVKSYEGLARTFENKKQIDSAYIYQSLFVRLKDSIYNEEIFRKTAFAQYAYNLDKKQNEIALLEEQRDKEVIFRNMIVVIGLLILLGSIVLYRNREKVKKANDLLNWQNIEIRQKTQEILLKNDEILSKNDEILVQNEELRQQKEEILAQRDDIAIKKQELEEKTVKIEIANRNMEIISEIGLQITATLNLEKAIMILYQYINQIMDADEFGIGTYEAQTNRISYDFYIYKGERLPFFQSFISDDRFSSWVIKHQTAIFIGDIRKEYSAYIKDFSYYEGDHILHSMICIPLLIENNVIGLVSVQSPKKHAYTEYHFDILQALASYMSIALENTKAYQIIEQKNKDITDSIRYAQNIQQAILPTADKLNSFFQDYFIIFRPKDIVSGDFYWFSLLTTDQFVRNATHEASDEMLNHCILAVVDCTGHGVPGAFMSMIGNTLLNEIVNIEKVISPSQILELLDKKIRLALQQKDSKNQDGMDISLCRIEKQEDTYKIYFAGAKSNLIYVDKGKKYMIKGDRHAIGGFRKKESQIIFTQHEIELVKDSLLYLYSDGYIDQGDLADKRLGTKQLETWIEEVHEESMISQKTFFIKNLEKHQQNAFQRDDITFLGLKI